MKTLSHDMMDMDCIMYSFTPDSLFDNIEISSHLTVRHALESQMSNSGYFGDVAESQTENFGIIIPELLDPDEISRYKNEINQLFDTIFKIKSTIEENPENSDLWRSFSLISKKKLSVAITPDSDLVNLIEQLVNIYRAMAITVDAIISKDMYKESELIMDKCYGIIEKLSIIDTKTKYVDIIRMMVEKDPLHFEENDPVLHSHLENTAFDLYHQVIDSEIRKAKSKNVSSLFESKFDNLCKEILK